MACTSASDFRAALQIFAAVMLSCNLMHRAMGAPRDYLPLVPLLCGTTV